MSLSAMQPLLRRRLNGLGRMAAQVSYDLQPAGESTSMPVVFASRYGDAKRSLAILDELSATQTISPTEFALAVHNAIGAVISIAKKDRSFYTAISAGASSACAGIIESLALLDAGAPSVLLVAYDDGLPGRYVEFQDEPQFPYAWAWRVRLANSEEPHLELKIEQGEPHLNEGPVGSATTTKLPYGLQVHRFAISDDATLDTSVDGVRWVWSRHD